MKTGLLKNNWLLLVVVAVIVAGGGVWLNYNFSAKLAALPTISQNSLDKQNNVIIRTANQVTVDQDDRTAQVAQDLRSGLVGLFKSKASGYYVFNQAEGQALILTSDGWLVSNSAGIKNNWADFVAVTADHQVLRINQAVADPLTGLTFLHLANAGDLSVKKLIEIKQLTIGESLLAYGWPGRVEPLHINQINQTTDGVRASDFYNNDILLSGNIAANNYLALADFSSNIVGLFNGKGQLVPADQLIIVLPGLLARQTINRVSLGVSYVPLDSVVSAYGAVGLRVTAVAPGGPAAAGGLRGGDILLTADNVELSGANDLANLLADYHIGDTMLLGYKRGGKNLQVELTLAKLK